MGIITMLPLLVVLLAPFSAGQQMTIMPEGDQVRPLGDSALLTCRVNGRDPTTATKLKWLDRNNNPIEITRGRVYIETDPNDKNMLKLYITNIVNSDAGRYTCQELETDPADGREISVLQFKHVNLDIYKDITFEGCEPRQYPVLHKKATIQCKVSGAPNPTVYWRFKDSRITRETHPRYSQTDYGLEISNVTQADQGVFTCNAEVETSGKYKFREINVEVHTPPKITSPVGGASGVATGVAGKDVDIKCSATGYPAPKYEFYKDGSPTKLTDTGEGTVVRRRVDEPGGAIYFRPLIEADAGRYLCKAINNAGHDVKEGTLKVIVPPAIPELYNTTLIEGQTGKLKCDVKGTPVPSISWRKWGMMHRDLVNGDFGGRVRLVQPLSNILELEISNMSNWDTSNYTCFGKNAGGVVNRTAHFMVEHAPRFAPDHLRELYNWRGRTRNITCTAIADPPPIIAWYHRNEQITRNNETFRLFPMWPGVSKISNLEVKVWEEHEYWVFGTYTCRASNKHGTNEIPINLKQAYVPGKPNNVIVKESNPTVIVFEVTPPTDNGGMPIYGYRVEYETRMTDFNLRDEIRIENLNPSTTYAFKIRAKNDVGVGLPFDLTHKTEDYSTPKSMVIISPHQGLYPYEYVLRWDRPRTGGLPITEYTFKLAPVSVHSGTWTVREQLGDWVETRKKDEEQAPIRYYTFKGLEMGQHYKVMCQAKNQMGYGEETSHVFRTLVEPGYAGEIRGSAWSMAASVTLVALLVAVCRTIC